MYDLNFHAANMYIVVLLWAFFSECVCVCVCVVWGSVEGMCNGSCSTSVNFDQLLQALS